jgi:NADH-quinone oxidoreductase subunit N
MYIFEDCTSEMYLNFESLNIMLLCVFGLLILIISNHFIVLYLGLELQSLAIYILCCLKRYSNKSVEAGLKYFIYGSYASLVLLLGISYIYLIFGTLNYNDINLLINLWDINNSILLHLALICILIGFLFKLAIAPFH